jgi:hypothetical protein
MHSKETDNYELSKYETTILSRLGEISFLRKEKHSI